MFNRVFSSIMPLIIVKCGRLISLHKHSFMPQISIITPVYNTSEFLPETIKSVLNQTFIDFEWLICDDCSTDNSVKIIRSFPDPRIVLTVAEKNGGAGFARNLSLSKASGRYVTFLDADDYWEPNFLEEMVNFMKNENAELVYSNYSRCDEDLNPKIDDFKADKEVNFNNLLKTCRPSLLSSMYDSQRIGIEFFPVGSKREDHVMWLNLLKKIPLGKPLPKTMAKYRMHSAGISRRKTGIIKDQYLVYKDYMKFSAIKSLYYTTIWAMNRFMKYSKVFN